MKHLNAKRCYMSLNFSCMNSIDFNSCSKKFLFQLIHKNQTVALTKKITILLYLSSFYSSPFYYLMRTFKKTFLQKFNKQNGIFEYIFENINKITIFQTKFF